LSTLPPIDLHQQRERRSSTAFAHPLQMRRMDVMEVMMRMMTDQHEGNPPSR
jgi:hypothetical protein